MALSTLGLCSPKAFSDLPQCGLQQVVLEAKPDHSATPVEESPGQAIDAGNGFMSGMENQCTGRRSAVQI